MTSPIQRYALLLVILCTLCIGAALAVSTYYINFWPTDSEYPYLPAAAKLFQLNHISEIHDLPWRGVLRVNMHGKESLIVGIAIFQKLLNDTQTLYPNVLLLIIAVCLSAILIYSIASRLFDVSTGLVMYILFAGCFWPYLYIIMGAHPPLGLFFFLLAVYCLLKAQQWKIFHFFSGLSLGLMLFSTPTAPVYLPYYAALWIFITNKYSPRKNIRFHALNAVFITLGMSAIFFIFTSPNPVANMRDYFEFMKHSQLGNNFIFYREYLERFFPITEGLRGGGWLWIFKYGFLIMPVIFPLYIVSILYLLKNSFLQKSLLALIALSFLAPLIIEMSGVVQFGRNYFVWYFGILGVIAFTFFDIKNKVASALRLHRQIFWAITAILLTIHVIWNISLYTREILPSRLVTTRIHDWLIKNNIKELYVYKNHPLQNNIINYFNNPKRKSFIKFNFINQLEQVQAGYILVPPLSGKTIYLECRFDNFYPDPDLTELYISGRLKDFTVTSFPSMGVSRIWSMEEEICAYRDLTLGQVNSEDRRKGHAWILDAQKLKDEWFSKKMPH